MPALVVVVVEVAVQGLVHRGAGEAVPILAPALDAHGAVGAFDDAVELRERGGSTSSGRPRFPALVLEAGAL